MGPKVDWFSLVTVPKIGSIARSRVAYLNEDHPAGSCQTRMLQPGQHQHAEVEWQQLQRGRVRPLGDVEVAVLLGPVVGALNLVPVVKRMFYNCTSVQ